MKHRIARPFIRPFGWLSTHLRGRLLDPLLIAATVLALAGCGHGGPADDPVQASSDDPQPTQPALVQTPAPPAAPVASTNIAIEPKSAGRIWVVNQDNDSVSVIDPVDRQRLAEIAVGAAPRTLAIGRDGQIWVASRDAATLSRIDPASFAVTAFALPAASQPFAVVASPSDGQLWVSLQATGEVVRVDPGSGRIMQRLTLGQDIRHLAMPASGDRLLVSRFITPPLPGEATETPQSETGGIQHGGELLDVDPVSGTVRSTIVLHASTMADSQVSARGIPNYVGAAAISPDGTDAWIPSKQDNVFRGPGRIDAATGTTGAPLTFETTVRAISSRVVLGASPAEDRPLRVDHDNASLASAAVYDPAGLYLIVALETSREIAMIDPVYGIEVVFRGGARPQTGRAPQGVAISADGKLLAVNNFMDRTVGLYDLGGLAGFQSPEITPIATIGTIGAEKLAATVLRGKQLFYDAFDPRLARDRYMSCASCHNDGGHDGRVWDFTSFDGVTPAEGLRNTISLRGRGDQPRLLHWTANFDEVQDFEGQIRGFAGGTGLMDDAVFASGTIAQPLGDRKTDLQPAARSADLDALAAYVASLSTHAESPWRNADRTLTETAATGRNLFQSKGCSGCHAGDAFAGTNPDMNLRRANIGTIKLTSGTGRGQPLTGLNAGINIPTLRDVWATAPYLHDGSAATLADAIDAHDPGRLTGGAPTAAERSALVEYLKQMGPEEAGF